MYLAQMSLIRNVMLLLFEHGYKYMCFVLTFLLLLLFVFLSLSSFFLFFSLFNFFFFFFFLHLHGSVQLNMSNIKKALYRNKTIIIIILEFLLQTREW